MKIGFIGLGLMGSHMARNILRAGFDLTVYNRTPSKAVELKKIGASIADSPKQMASEVDIVITMVTAARDLEEILFGKAGVTKSKKRKLTVIDMETIGPTAAKKIAARLKKMGVEMIDAPVTGSTPGAEAGTLTIFAGGNPKTFEKIKPVLEAMGKSINYLGPSGSGQAIKMINNQVIASTIAAAAEGMILADAMALERKKAAQILKNTPAFSFFMGLKMENFVTDNFPLLFSASNMKKDLSLAVKEMRKGRKRLPLLEKTEKLYALALKKGLSNEDMSSIIKILEK